MKRFVSGLAIALLLLVSSMVPSFTAVTAYAATSGDKTAVVEEGSGSVSIQPLFFGKWLFVD